MTRYMFAQEPVRRPSIRPATQILQRRCSACGGGEGGKQQCPELRRLSAGAPAKGAKPR